MASFPELYIQWDGREYRCIVNMEVLSQIEQRFALQELAETITGNPEMVKHTQLAWTFYCLLRSAGAPVTSDEVRVGLRDGDISQADLQKVMQFVLVETYGPAPEKKPKKQTPQTAESQPQDAATS